MSADSRQVGREETLKARRSEGWGLKRVRVTGASVPTAAVKSSLPGWTCRSPSGMVPVPARGSPSGAASCWRSSLKQLMPPQHRTVLVPQHVVAEMGTAVPSIVQVSETEFRECHDKKAFNGLGFNASGGRPSGSIAQARHFSGQGVYIASRL